MHVVLLLHFASLPRRSSSMRTDITTHTVSAVAAVTALWQTNPSPARVTHWSAVAATAMNFLPSAPPVTRQSCQVVTIKTGCISMFTDCWVIKVHTLCEDEEANEGLLSWVWQLRYDTMIVSKLWKRACFFSSGHFEDADAALVSDDWKSWGPVGRVGDYSAPGLYRSEQSFSSVSVRPGMSLESCCFPSKHSQVPSQNTVMPLGWMWGPRSRKKPRHKSVIKGAAFQFQDSSLF